MMALREVRAFGNISRKDIWIITLRLKAQGSEPMPSSG
jgi:hypothetical protein